MLTLIYVLLYAILFLFGSVIFSFLNVVIYRVPRGISIAKGRSFCPDCGHTLWPSDLVPVLSYLLLRGRCRYCGKKISLRYPTIELLGGGMAVFFYVFYGISTESIVLFYLGALLTSIAMIDYDTMTIPNGLVAALLPLAAAVVFWIPTEGLLSRILGLLIFAGPMVAANGVVQDSFGGGDIKLAAVCGWILGWQSAVVGLFFSLLFGGAKGILLLLKDRKNRKSHFAFGPYLCIGIGVAAVWGERLFQWYLHWFQ